MYFSGFLMFKISNLVDTTCFSVTLIISFHSTVPTPQSACIECNSSIIDS